MTRSRPGFAAFLAPTAAELFRLTRSRSGRFGLLAPALLALGRVVGGQVAEMHAAAQRASEGRPAADPADVTAFGPLADGIATGTPLLALVALLLGAFTLVRERDAGALSQLLLARPRGAVVVGKLLGTCLYLLASVLLVVVASAAAATPFLDFTAHVEDGDEAASAGRLWLQTARALGGGFPAVIACAAFGLCVSACSASTGAAAVGALVPFTLLGLFQSLLGRIAPELFITYVPFFGDRSPLSRLPRFARCDATAYWEPWELTRATLVPGITTVALVAIAWLVTRRRSA